MLTTLRVLVLWAAITFFAGPVSAQVQLTPEEANKLLVEKPRVHYPPLAKAARVEGIVKVETIVSERGRVVSVKAIGGHPLLRDAAEAGVKGCKYKAHIAGGKRVRFITIVDILFPPPVDRSPKRQDEHQKLPTELESKYGPPLKAYEIRRGIMMTVKFDFSGHVSEMGIERRVFHDTFIDLDPEIPRDLAQEIVDELAPKAKRGTKLKDLEWVSIGDGQRVVSGQDYWNVSITYFGNRTPDGANHIVGIKIAWKDRN